MHGPTPYLNPIDMTKEQWLDQNALLIPQPKEMPEFDDEIYVCLVQNPKFTAAGVALTQYDLDRFLAPDPRPKKWYLANKPAVMKEIRHG